VEVVVRVFLVATAFAEGEVLLPVVRNDAVGDAVGAKAIEDAVDRRPVDTVTDGSQDFVVTKRRTGLFKHGQNSGFRGRISAFHDLLLRRRCNNKKFSVVLQSCFSL
jgi:hypothetical protein